MNVINEVKVLSPEQESVKNLAITKIEKLDELKSQRKAAREMLTSQLLQNVEYANVQKEVKHAKLKLSVALARANDNPEVANLQKKLDDLNRQYKELRSEISDYLVTYQQMTGQLSFLHPNGTEIHIEQSAKPKIVQVQPRTYKRK
jgi:ABC-type phosphate transport system auxiliary subunit